MDDETKLGKGKLWLDAEVRRHYPLTAQRLKEAAFQEQVDLGYRRYTEVLRSLRAAAEISSKELSELSMKEEGLEFIVEGNIDKEDVPRSSHQEDSRSLQESGKQQALKDQRIDSA